MSTVAPIDIIYFSSIDWGHTWQRPQQLASRLARFGRLLYISPIGLRRVALRDLGRVLRRIASQSQRPAIQPGQALTVYTPPLYIPFPNARWARQINAWMLDRAVNRWMDRVHVHAPIVWVSIPSPSIVDAIRKLDTRLLVYDCLDNFPAFHKNVAFIAETEQQLAARADVVFATSVELYNGMKSINPRTHLLPNAVDYHHFAEAAGRGLASLREMMSLRRPILGYVGELAQWFDFDLADRLAVEHPEWSIVLVGPLRANGTPKLLGRPNVHYLGVKDYHHLPAYVNQFDVCLLPFKITPLTSSVNPVKLYEYLAAGKPIVSTPLNEVLPYRAVVNVAAREEFSAAVETVLRTDYSAETLVRQRREVARCNTWDQRVEQIIAVLSQFS